MTSEEADAVISDAILLNPFAFAVRYADAPGGPGAHLARAARCERLAFDYVARGLARQRPALVQAEEPHPTSQFATADPAVEGGWQWWLTWPAGDGKFHCIRAGLWCSGQEPEAREALAAAALRLEGEDPARAAK